MPEPGPTIEQVFREESGKIVASLIRLSGSFDWAEEALQDAFISALSSWPEKGMPANPSAWIMTAARNRLVDFARRDRTRANKESAVAYDIELRSHSHDSLPEVDAMHLPDDRLRLIFTCCHPALNQEAQVALTLRTLGGLTTPEIARAFLVPEATMGQRLVRAKRKIEQAAIPYETPPPEQLPERLASVMSVVYLVFNEGYAATAGSALIRRELCQEAIRLARILSQLMPDEPEIMGLLALMLFRTRAAKLASMPAEILSSWKSRTAHAGTVPRSRKVRAWLKQRCAAIAWDPTNSRLRSPPCMRMHVRAPRPTGKKSPRSMPSSLPSRPARWSRSTMRLPSLWRKGWRRDWRASMPWERVIWPTAESSLIITSTTLPAPRSCAASGVTPTPRPLTTKPCGLLPTKSSALI